MNHPCSPPPSNRSTLGEALIVLAVVAGFFWSFAHGQLLLQEIGLYAGFLVAIVVFYMALLLCRMLFFWMTGGDTGPQPWWAHEEHVKHHKEWEEARGKK